MESPKTLRIENGQFMRGNTIVKPEIGNKEQIECFQALERQMERAANDGIDCSFEATNISYDSKIYIHCVCGKSFHETDRIYLVEMDDLDNLDEEWDDKIVKCPHCKREYKVQDGCAKLISK